MATQSGVRSASSSYPFLKGTDLPEARPVCRPKSPLAKTIAEEFEENREQKVGEIISLMCPAELEIWMNEMPKGGDLNVDLIGSISAEKYLELAVRQELKYTNNKFYFVRNTAQTNLPEEPAKTIQDDPKVGTEYLAQCRKSTDQNSLHIFEDLCPIYSIADITPINELVEIVRDQAKREHLLYLEMRMGLSHIKKLSSLFSQIRDRIPFIRFHVSVRRDEPNFQKNVQEAFRLMKEYPEDIVSMSLAGLEKSLRNLFSEQMRMIDECWISCKVKPKMSLPCGELTEENSTREVMSDRILSTLKKGHCNRILHGDSIVKESDAPGVLNLMSAFKIAVGICFSSSEKRLGIKASEHSVHIYKKKKVPVVICSEAAGENRASLTTQYYKAIKEYGFTYSDVKQFLRNSLEYSFLPGKSIFNSSNSSYEYLEIFEGLDGDDWDEIRAGSNVKLFLEGSPKARLQVQLERELVEFEQKVIKQGK